MSVRRVFISYRREDCQPQANGLADGLAHRLPAAEIFMDIDSIPPGADFEQHIRSEIESCDVVLALVGDNWLDTVAGADRRRIDDPEDFVRLEIETALQRGVTVIPVLVEGARMPRSDQLPKSIARLARIQAIDLSDQRWRADVGRVAEAAANVSARTHPGRPTAANLSSRTHPGRPNSRKPPAPDRVPARIDFSVARAFIESVPAGRWASYKDVATAAGSPAGAMAVGNWLLTQGEQIPNVWRVLNSRGEVAAGWAPSSHDLPSTPEAVRQQLRAEGIDLDHRGRASQGQRWRSDHLKKGADGLGPGNPLAPDSSGGVVVVAGKNAYPEYLRTCSYICQAGRAFRDVERMGFYLRREIKPEFPEIRCRRDGVPFTASHATELRLREGPFDHEMAILIEDSLHHGAAGLNRREPGTCYQVFLLTGPTDHRTLRLPHGVAHAGRGAWTQSQRYTTVRALRTGAETTDAL